MMYSGGIWKDLYQYFILVCIHINTYKLRWTVALEFITVAVLRYVVLSQDDMYQLILLAIAKAVGGRQDVSAVDQTASTVVLDISLPIWLILTYYMNMMVVGLMAYQA